MITIFSGAPAAQTVQLAKAVKTQETDLAPFPNFCREWAPGRTAEVFPDHAPCDVALLPKVRPRHIRRSGRQDWDDVRVCRHFGYFGFFIILVTQQTEQLQHHE